MVGRPLVTDGSITLGLTLRLQVDANGRMVRVGVPAGRYLLFSRLHWPGSRSWQRVGRWSQGKPGIYDEHTARGAATRRYDNFHAFCVPPSDGAVLASQSLEVRHDAVIREDSAGLSGRPSPSTRATTF